MISPLPFYFNRKYASDCNPCCKGQNKAYKQPVPENFIPFQIEVEGEYGGVNQNIDFFNSLNQLVATKDLGLVHEICNGKTLITGNNCEPNTDYEINDTNWSSTGTIDNPSNSVNLMSGENMTNIVPFPTGKKYNVQFTVTGVPCPTTVDYTITIEYPTLSTIIVYQGNVCQTHNFEIPEATEAATLKVSYGIGAGEITVFGWLLEQCPPDNFLPICDELYARIELDGGTYMYSELFQVHSTEAMDECYIKIVYENTCYIDCFAPFEGYFFLHKQTSAIGIPTYPVEILGEDDDAGNFIQERVKVSKQISILAAQVPEYMVDFLNYMQLFDISIEQFGKVYTAESFEITTDWINNIGCYADVRVLVTIDTRITQKCCVISED